MKIHIVEIKEGKFKVKTANVYGIHGNYKRIYYRAYTGQSCVLPMQYSKINRLIKEGTLVTFRTLQYKDVDRIKNYLKECF